MEDILEKILKNIKEGREKKGYSQENMAHMLDLGQVAYTKLENNKTKLSVERLYKIAEILEVEVGDLLGIQAKNQFNQTNNGNSTGYLQQIKNFHQENGEQHKKMVEFYESIIKEKEELVQELRSEKKK